MATYSSIQQRALDLKNEALETIPDLEPFYFGNVPKIEHYKRLNLDYERAKQIASYGYLRSLNELNVKLYFTQALIVGSAVLGTHHKIFTVLPSQYGKSFLSACIALLLASDGEPVSVSANDGELTKKIMSEVRKILPGTSAEFKKKLTTPIDKFEKAQTGLSKNFIGFIGGGYVEGLTLGGKYNDPLAGNKAVGQSGNYIIDESALIPDGNYAETGRSEVGYRRDGRPYVAIEMSNPHQINHFYRDMTQDPMEQGALVVWADIRISMEEGKQVFYEQDQAKPKFEQTKFFKNESTCLSYLLCDFGNLSDGSFFHNQPIVNNQPTDLSKGSYVLGLDSANRGADSIMGCILKVPTPTDQFLKVEQLINFKPSIWRDYETPREIVALIIALLRKVNITAICLDLGSGEWLLDKLGNAISEAGLNVQLKGVYFNNSPTKERVRDGFDYTDGTGNGAELGVNKRAEMYLDVRNLMDTRTIQFTQKTTDVLQPEFNALGKEIYTTNSKIQLEDKTRFVKKRLGRSPDSSDALVLAVHAYILQSLGLIEIPVLNFYD